MSTGDSPPLPRRPATARPRSDAVEHGDADAAAPTHEELETMERKHIELTTHAGAEVVDDESLGVEMVRLHGRGPGLNYAAQIRWSSADADERIQALDRAMREAGEWPVISVADGLTEPADLVDRLEALGWVRLSGERMMTTRHAPVVPHLDPGLRVEAVTPASALDAARLEVANFDLSLESVGERAERLAHAVQDGTIRAFLLRLVHEPVASLRLTSGPGVASLSAVGVAARHRRRGYGQMITAVATRAGLATGHKLVWLSVIEENVGAVALYRSLGFEPSFAWSRWAAPAD